MHNFCGYVCEQPCNSATHTAPDATLPWFACFFSNCAVMAPAVIPEPPWSARLTALLLALVLAGAAPMHANNSDLPVVIESRTDLHDLTVDTVPATAPALHLTLVNVAHWPEADIIAALRVAVRILAQCNIRISRAEMLRISVPEPYRDFATPRSRTLAAALALPKPTLYFVADTRQRPAFDAEAIGRGNSRTRPELADTVWITRDAGRRDTGIVMAHELAHVLMDSGAHVSAPGNLMAEFTAPDNTALTDDQCRQMHESGTRHGLLRSGLH